MGWYKETDPEKIQAFEENKKTFEAHNPDIEVVTVMNRFDDPMEAWMCCDLPMFQWYIENGKKQNSDRYLLVEWDCWCNCDIRQYFSKVWECDVVAPAIKYPERDDWIWFDTIPKLPVYSRKFATGVMPMCGMFLSDHAMNEISREIIKPEYGSLISELRVGTVATMLGLDPVMNPVCNRSISWKEVADLGLRHKGFIILAKNI